MYYVYCKATHQRLIDWNPTQVRIADLFLGKPNQLMNLAYEFANLTLFRPLVYLAQTSEQNKPTSFCIACLDANETVFEPSFHNKISSVGAPEFFSVWIFNSKLCQLLHVYNCILKSVHV